MRTIRRTPSTADDMSHALRRFAARRTIELAGLSLMALTGAIAVALITWSVRDPSLTHATDGRVTNWLGSPGAIVSDVTMQLFGIGAIALLVPLAIWGFTLLTGHRLARMKLRLPLWIIGAAAAAAVASALPATERWPLPTGLGGVVGDAVLSALRTVLSLFGQIGMALAGFIYAGIAILALSAACGFGLDESQEAERAAMPRRDTTRRDTRSSEDDSDEPGWGIISLGAIVHGMMMLKSAVARRTRRKPAPLRGAASGAAHGAAYGAAHQPGGRPQALAEAMGAEGMRAEGTGYGAPDDYGAAYEPAPRPPQLLSATGLEERHAQTPFVAEDYAPARPSRVVMPPDYHTRHDETYQPAAYEQWDEPAAAAPRAPEMEPEAPMGPAPKMALEPKMGTVWPKVIPTAAAIAAAAELSGRFAARVRRKPAARAAEDQGDARIEPAFEEVVPDERDMPEQFLPAPAAEEVDAPEAPAPFILNRRAERTETARPEVAAPPQPQAANGVSPWQARAGSAAPNGPSHGGQTHGGQAHGGLGPRARAIDYDDEGDDEDLAPRVSPPPQAPRQGRRLEREAQPSLLDTGEYELPPLTILAEPKKPAAGSLMSAEALEQNASMLEGVLEDFGVRGEIINVRPGPVVTLYELEPAPGTKSSRVISLADDIARSMSAISARVAVVPGRNAIGIELPNHNRETVFLREQLASRDFEASKSKLALCLGKTIGGEPVIVDLARMPHLLVAGTTGSGKSVAINTMILSLLYRLKPEECRLIMVDPKMLELSIYDGIPHLLTPVVTDPKKAVVALKWAVREMEERYKKMAKVGVRNIDGFNVRVAEAKAKGEIITRTVQTGFDKQTGEAIYEDEEMDLDTLPYIVVIVDEMADLMMVAGKEIEGTIQRLAQMARAAGIHVVLATQRPSVDVITGTIKANFPTRISFQVTSKIDSRTILGEMGAEQLLGQGDMLYMAGGGRITRVHGPFVSDNEVEKVVAHLKTQGRPQYLEAVTTAEGEGEAEDTAVFDQGNFGSASGDLYDQAIAIVLRDKKASTSYIQRRLQIGYNRAASLMERMELEGIVGAANHAGKREILLESVGQAGDNED